MEATSDTPLIGAKIKELQSQVAQYSGGKKGANFAFKINRNTWYIVIPVAVLVLLLFLRPGFIKVDYIDDDGKESKKLGFRKLLIAWLIISALLNIGLFGLNYRKKANSV